MKQLKKNKSRLLAMLLTFMMIFSLIPATAFAEPIDASDAPFEVLVDDEVMTAIDKGVVTWTGWVAGDFDCYTVTVPAEAEEATLTFEEEKQWTYYDVEGNYIGEGDTSWTPSAEHAVAIQDSNDDGALDGISVQNPETFSTEYLILFVYEEAKGVDAPFTATVNDQEMKVISEDVLQWTGWDGSASNVTCYTVEVPAVAEEATLCFDDYKNWNYYDSKGNYIAEGSFDVDSEHTVAIQDSNGDGELDGISVQIPGEFSAEYFILFVYEGAHVHSYGDWSVTKNATCAEEGVETRICTKCDEETEGHADTRTIAKKAHTYGEWGQTKAPTCTEKGQETRVCSACPDTAEGHTQKKDIAKLGHTYGDWSETKAPTCTEKGEETRTCSVCAEGTTGHKETRATDAKGHTRGDDTTCDVCGDVAPNVDENNVYILSNADELLWFAKTVNKGETGISGKLAADIDLSDIKDKDGNSVNWPGIGTSENKFSGTFDGQNHTVTLNGSTWGLFGYAMGTYKGDYNKLDKAVVIQNVIVEGSVKNSAIVHNAGYARITNCINKADIYGGNSNVAGILGTVLTSTKAGNRFSDVVIQNCGNEGNIEGGNNTGGILGYAITNTRIDNCYNSGDISGSGNVGGLAGYMQGSSGDCEINNSYNTGSVTGSTAAAGILGNQYNSVYISNCYNAGEATYAIAGNIYSNSVGITNTYYAGTLSAYSVPDFVQGATAKYTERYTKGRGTSVTKTEMSSEEFAAQLNGESGESAAFKQSCPSPVLTWQTAADHTYDKNEICEDCGQGSNPRETYNVSFSGPEGCTFEGSETYTGVEDKWYTFSILVDKAYYTTADFAVYVNGEAVILDAEGSCTIPHPEGPLSVVVTGVKKIGDKAIVVLPKAGNGYTVVPCDGYSTEVSKGNDYKFKVELADGFKAGRDFAVNSVVTPLSGETAVPEILTPDADGVYTIKALDPVNKYVITIDGVDIIPTGESVSVNIEITDGPKEFVWSEETDAIMLDKTMEIEYFDIGLYDLERYYYNPYCYVDEKGNIRSSQVAGTRESAYGVVTSMHAFIYMTEVYYLGIPEEDAGTGYSDTVDTDGDGKSDFDEAVSWTQNAGSSFMNLWGKGTNLNYHLNYRYPLAYTGWGSTSDQQALKDGDRLSIHFLHEGSGSSYGVFVVNDTNNKYNNTDERDCVTVKQGDVIKLTHYSADQGYNYSTSFKTVANKELYWIDAGDEVVDITEWYCEGFGNIAAEDFKTDENGEITIDTAGIEPGTYYIGAAGGFVKGDGTAGADGFKSEGAEGGPAYFKLTVEVSQEVIDAREAAIAEVDSAYADKITANKDKYSEKVIEELEDILDELEDEINEAASLDAVEVAKAAAIEAINSVKTIDEEKVEELEADLAAAEAAKAELQSQITSLTTQLDAAVKENTEVKASIAELTEQLGTANADKEDLAKQAAELQTQLDESAATITALKAAIAELNSQISESEALNKAEKDKLNAQIEELKASLEEAEDSNTALTEKVTKLEADLAAANAAKAELEKQIAELEAALKAAQNKKTLSAPTAVKTSNIAKTGKIQISWKAVKNADEYDVYSATSKNGKYKKIATTTRTSFTNASAKAGQTYYYKVKAKTDDKSVNNSVFSKVVKGTCDLSAPVVKVKKAGKKKVKVSWNAVKGAKTYVVYRATSANGKYVKVATTKKLSFTNKKLKSGKTYYYKVKAISKNTAANSAFSSVKKCKAK